jgi:polyisoprenoid-binding protein YceI
MGSVTAYEPSQPSKQRNTAEYGTREPYYCSNALQRTSSLPRVLAFPLLVFLACSREEKRPERTEPWPASSAAPSSSARPTVRRAHYEVETAEVTFELPAKLGSPRGRFPGTIGRFDVDLENPERSSGSVRVDLGLVELDGAGSDGGAADATRRALEWLELGSEIPAAEREPRRFATFQLRGVEGAEGKSALFRERRDGRRPRLDGTAFGELSLHGVRAPVRMPVSLEIEPATSPDAAPERLVIRSRAPLVVSLGVHDIRPRDARGVLVARELTLIGENVGRDARVTFELGLVKKP